MSQERVKEARKPGFGDDATPPHQCATPLFLEFVNRQRAKQINLHVLENITVATLAELPGVTGWNLTLHLVGAKKMAGVNKAHLSHAGPTDVITFDYAEPAAIKPPPVLFGDIFVCVPIAVSQAREFHTTWQSEIVRYFVHALLHLYGHDDQAANDRQRMKAVENRLVRKLARHFSFAALGRIERNQRGVSDLPIKSGKRKTRRG